MLSLDQIRLALDTVTHEPVAFSPEPRHAAVAMVLADGTEGLEACFIRRAERAGDPWSGQVAFPGGRAGPGDLDPAAVAERETLEEVGLVLGHGDRVGALPPHAIVRHGNDMTLSPFVYYLGPDAAGRTAQELAAPGGAHEVASVFWVPLDHLFDVSTTTSLDYASDGVTASFPGIRFGEHVIWGLTLRVLGSFATLVRRPLPALEAAV